MRVRVRTLTGILAGAMLAIASTATGCVVVPARPSRAEVATPPPPPAQEPAISCAPGHVRMAGHFLWNGYGYVWVAQRCSYRPGFRWEASRYEACGDGWCFREGIWVPQTGK